MPPIATRPSVHSRAAAERVRAKRANQRNLSSRNAGTPPPSADKAELLQLGERAIDSVAGRGTPVTMPPMTRWHTPRREPCAVRVMRHAIAERQEHRRQFVHLA